MRRFDSEGVKYVLDRETALGFCRRMWMNLSVDWRLVDDVDALVAARVPAIDRPVYKQGMEMERLTF